MDQTIMIITIDQVTVLRTEIKIIKMDEENFLNHCTEKTHNIKLHSKTIEVVHPYLKDKLTKYNQLKQLNQTLPLLITQKSQNCN